MGRSKVKLIKIVHEEVREFDKSTYGVLDTPCYPCQYYGGPIRKYDGEWYNSTNATSFFFRTIGEAENSILKKLFFAMKKIEIKLGVN